MDNEAWKFVGIVFIILVALLVAVVALRRRGTLPGEDEAPVAETPVDPPAEPPAPQPVFPDASTGPFEPTDSPPR